LTLLHGGAALPQAAAAAKAGAGCKGSSNGTSKRGCGSYWRENLTGGVSMILLRDFPVGPC